MGNGLSACTGMIGKDMVQNDAIRRFSARLGSEAIRVGQALGYELEEIQPPRSGDHRPRRRRRAGGDAEYDEHRLAEVSRPAAASIGRRWARTW